MLISAVMDGVGQSLGSINDLRVHPYYADKLTPPAAVVGWPDEYDYDQAFGRGADRVVIPLTVVVGRADARTSRDRLAVFADGAGDSSIKAAIEAFESDAWDSARVTKVEFGAVTIASTSYLSATFDIEIIGKGF